MVKADKMRNEDLDKKLPIDENIGELLTDENGEYRMVNSEKIYQIKEETQHDKDMNLIINRVRSSGMMPSEYLRMSCGF
jgi:hypothetical protein